MSYIYKITNTVNGKVYVGNTSRSIEKRWHEHCSDAKRDRSKHRPLYAAINKYGIEKFKIEAIEECDMSIAPERERYWIERLGTFKDGYNNTMGGDGKPYIDYELVAVVYRKTGQIKRTAEMLGICVDSVAYALDAVGEKKPTPKEAQRYKSKMVNALSRTGEYIRTFESLHDATEWIKAEKPDVKSESAIRSHIQQVCEHKRKSAYNCIWEYAI